VPNGNGPYLERADTIEHIEQIAAQDRIIIYAGSGVSIDKTGMNWPTLVQSLMDRVGDPELQTFSPLESASIVKQLLLKEYGDERINGKLADELRRLLYPSQMWRQAELPHAVMRLIAELHNQGRDYHVFTTNYDDFLERQKVLLDAQSREKQGGALALESVALDYNVDIRDRADLCEQVEKYTSCEPDRRLLVHLHGYVPQDPADRATFVTFSEVDYARSYRLSAEVLEQVLREHSMLVIGSSLTDPPLLNALAKTAEDAKERQLTRLAIMPLQGLRVPLEDEKRTAAMCKNVNDRMEHFEVEVTFPDFYSQTAQLLTEIRVAARERRDGRRYVGSPAEHRNRLHQWWSEWKRDRCGDWAAANARDHEVLLARLQTLQKAFKVARETMKLEIWIRWEPAPANRTLKLWASSTGTWPDERSMPTATIGNNSQYVSVQTFCLGRPGVHVTKTDRWRTYLSVPIWVGAEQSQDLPVAVLSLASMEEETRIDRKEAARISNMVEELTTIGKELVSGARPDSG
jgi:NAD-dependent SIR2 family protein deacetylase